MIARRIVIYGFLLAGSFLLSYTVRAQSDCTGEAIFAVKACNGDALSGEEKVLFESINSYRKSAGMPEIKISKSLSALGNRRILDLNQNMKTLTHSWSNCPYDIKDDRTWHCQIDSPARLHSGYDGQGYETLFRVINGRATPVAALDAWKKSPLHDSIILNKSMFERMSWDELGVAINGEYASVWFGFAGNRHAGIPSSILGLGVSYEQAVAGLSKVLSIEHTSSNVTNNSWHGFSPDKKVNLEINGSRSDIQNAVVTVGLDPNGEIDPAKKLVLAMLMKNIFPEWRDPDIDSWLEKAIDLIAQNPTAWRSKTLRNLEADIRLDRSDALRLSIRPGGKPAAVEIF